MIYLIRHGKTEGNLKKRYIGTTDEPLCPQGVKELSQFHYPKVDAVFSSPLKRCVQTAQLLFLQQPVVLVEGLKECNFGEFDGKNYLELSDDPQFQAWMQSGVLERFPGGESQREFKTRCVKAFHALNFSPYTDVAVVCHGGVIMAILEHYLGGDFYSYHLNNGEGYAFDWNNHHILNIKKVTA